MANKNEIKGSDIDWPVSFEDVEADHLNEILKLTPAQRLELAEALLEFAVLAGAVKKKGSQPPPV